LGEIPQAKIQLPAKNKNGTDGQSFGGNCHDITVLLSQQGFYNNYGKT
jgi:hypothetical protein